MSYDIRLGVKVEGMDGYIATIDEPSYSSPTYNLRDMFVACMDWDYEQGEWYNCGDVFQNIIRGQNEITAFPEKYKKYNATNGWGTVSSAKKCIDSIVQKIGEITSGEWTWNKIPLEHLWIRW